MIVLMTQNTRKIPEYKAFFKRHAQTLTVEELTESPATLSAWLNGKAVRGILKDESNIYTPEGDLVRPNYQGPAINLCILQAWVLENGQLVRRAYRREVEGMFDGANLRPDDKSVFDWDSAFSPLPGLALHDMALVGLKNSAREHCLSAFVKEYLRQEPKITKFREPSKNPESIVDWNTDARFLTEHPLYQQLPPMLGNALAFTVNSGVFFRAARARRDGNYWLPGLNGGIPYVPKDDSIHEATYLFHDSMHQLLPDLVFDGRDTALHRQIYICYRMMSEAVSLVLADMCFAASLQKHFPEYDYAKRRILPLYHEMAGAEVDVRELLYRMTRYVLLADARGFPTKTIAWKKFEEKYSKFFIGDFQWTKMNWQNLFGRKNALQRLVQLVGEKTLRDQNLWLVSDVVNHLPRRPENVSDLVDDLFALIWNERLKPALSYTEEANIERSRSNGFRRWLTGQCAFFARYEPIVGLPALASKLAERVRSPEVFMPDEMLSIRKTLRTHIESLAKQGILSDDDAFMFPDVFPLFDPFFLKDYDRGAQEFTDLGEASRAALN